MGYEVYIRRDEGESVLTIEQWLEYVKLDVEFSNETHSDNNKKGELFYVTAYWNEDIPFHFWVEFGEISFKNPEYSVLEKMVSIASKLNAIVIGEEGEIYDLEYLKSQKDIDKDALQTIELEKERKWWQFWK